MRFFYHYSFVVGYTILIVLFVTNYGILSLPYFFILNGLFAIFGSMFYSSVLDECNRQKVLYYTFGFVTLTLLMARHFADTNLILFFAFMIVSVSVFLTQIRMMLIAHMEDMFTPLESERTFPVVESADTIGGIASGLTILIFTNFFNGFNFIYFWIVCLAVIVGFFIFCESKKYAKEHKPTIKSSIGVVNQMKEAMEGKVHYRYLKGMFLIVFIHWALFNLLEFQYTKAVFSNVQDVIVDLGSGVAHAFIHDLGQLFILFSGSALFIQLFAGSRIMKSFGVVGSMLFHAYVTVLSFMTMLFGFNFYTAVVTKNNFTMTSVIHTNAYHTSYYAIHHKYRVQIREFLEGIIRPLGIIASTALILIFQKLFPGETFFTALNVLMIIGATLLLIVNYRQKENFTAFAVDDLLHSDLDDRLNAIDILSQSGHEGSYPLLCDILFNKKEEQTVRERILYAMIDQDHGHFRDMLKEKVNTLPKELRPVATDYLKQNNNA
jgi:hypothetical protein